MSQVIYDMKADDYHNLPHLSKSGLDLINKSPRHYWVEKFSNDAELKKEATKALRVGAALHTYILEPERFDLDVAIAPDCDKRTKEGKQLYANFVQLSSGKIVISESEFMNIEYMNQAVNQSPVCAKLLELKQYSEVTCLYELEGVPFKSRFDGLLQNDFIVDLKTSRNAEANKFDISLFDYRYHVQAALYIDAFEICFDRPCKGFVIIPVENTKPFVAGQPILITKESYTYEIGKDAYLRDIATFKLCKEKNEWRGYDDDTTVRTDISIPVWVQKKYENNLINKE